MTIIVPARGPSPALWMIVGEAPGRQEAEQLSPFVGKSGEEQDAYLSRYGVRTSTARITNVVPEYIEGNPDPTVALVRKWAPHLIDEIRATNPRLIVAVGRFAMRWFLGESADLDTCHGLPHKPGAFDPSRADRVPTGCIIVPVVHPAAGFYDTDARSVIAWDYAQVAAVLRDIEAGRPIDTREDEHAGREQYTDLTRRDLACYLSVSAPPIIGLDTEGTPDAPWSIQISTTPGTGMVLRCSQPDFAEGIEQIQYAADKGTTIAIHNALYDLEMCKVMGLDLFHPRVRLYDTMYAAYLTRLEPQGLKPLAWRWCGMRMQSYMDTVGDAGMAKQEAYLERVLELTRKWPKPEPRLIDENDGTARLYKPQPVYKRVDKILIDYYLWQGEGREDNGDAEPFDLRKRWLDVDREQRLQVERAIGPMPIGTLDDIPLDRAVTYSARDPDATLRLALKLMPHLDRHNLSQLMSDGMDVLPVFAEMQMTGMPASRKYFERLSAEMTEYMMQAVAKLSARYFSGKPINPNSADQVRQLMRRRGLSAMKLTKSKQDSTSKPSIEHLRYEDPAMELVFDAREHCHIRDKFCQVVLDRMPDGDSDDVDIYPVRCNIKTTRTATRRLASSDPNLLAIPSRTELGRRVRSGYICPPGQVFGAWDLSQIEARFLAHESQDATLLRLFNEPDEQGKERDIHKETAAYVFGVPLSAVTSDQRRAAKTINFGIFYGMSGHALATQLRMQNIKGWPDARCERAIADWFRVYTGVKQYIDTTTRDTRRTGEVRDCWGMVRYLPAIWAADKYRASDRSREAKEARKLAAEAGRHAVSHKIQGGAQGMIQRSIAWLRPRIRAMQDAGHNVHWCLQIHDEIILRFDVHLWEELNALVLEALTEHCGMALRVPVLAEGNKADSWGLLKA